MPNGTGSETKPSSVGIASIHGPRVLQVRRARKPQAEGRDGVKYHRQALHAKIGQLTLENDFLSGALGVC
jgi:hypothetical protein